MAFGQIDPARLEGDALRRWYLRSPADIEAERRQKAASTYHSFFSQQTSNPISAEASYQQDETSDDHPWSSWQQLKGGRWRGERADAHPPAGQYQLAAASPRGFWDYWSPKGCQNCHGYTPDTLPPVGGQSPFPPNYSPRAGGGSGDSGAQPRGRDKKECDQQAASDSQICGRLRSPQDIAICRETASRRYAHCLRPDGTIGFPPLETKGGRRP